MAPNDSLFQPAPTAGPSSPFISFSGRLESQPMLIATLSLLEGNNVFLYAVIRMEIVELVLGWAKRHTQQDFWLSLLLH
jgi:hypothetical protein